MLTTGFLDLGVQRQVTLLGRVFHCLFSSVPLLLVPAYLNGLRFLLLPAQVFSPRAESPGLGPIKRLHLGSRPRFNSGHISNLCPEIQHRAIFYIFKMCSFLPFVTFVATFPYPLPWGGQVEGGRQ